MKRMIISRDMNGSLLEIGPVLWFLLLLLTFPLLNLSTVALRYTFLMTAGREAAQAASVAKTFITDATATDKSAVNAAQSTANTVAATFKGVHLRSVQTNIVVTNVATGLVTRQSTPLAVPADTTTNFYQLEVVATADVDPLVFYTGRFFGSVPALTAPARFVIATQQVCENPNGMNQ